MNRGGRPRADAVPSDYDAGFADEDEATLIADPGVYFSADGRRRQDVLLNVSHKKRRLQPTGLDDPLAALIPVPEDQVDTSFAEEEEPDISDPVLGDKCKHYEGSVSFFFCYLHFFLFIP
jgi:hypothetical protein